MMSEAGLKGARAKVRSYREEIENLFFEGIEPLLHEGKGEGSISVDEGVCRLLLDNTPSLELIEQAVLPNHVHLLVRQESECDFVDYVNAWKSLSPDTEWAESFHIVQVDRDHLSRYYALIEEDCRQNWSSCEKSCVGEDETVLSAEGSKEVSTSTTAEHTPWAEGEIDFHHVSVLPLPTLEVFAPQEGKLIVDATLGGGGHTEALLESGASVIGIDQDPDARAAASRRLARFGSRFRVLSGNFRHIKELLQEIGIEKVDGILADIGVSSHQIDTAERGFSFRENGPLDMRMSPEIERTAADWVNTSSEEELTRIFREYGEERAARSFARMIVRERERAPITTTGRLASLAEKSIPRRGGAHPGTKSFQALRIAVNDELGALSDLLKASVSLLSPGGRLAVITFHSLEDRVVKRFMDEHSRPECDRPEWPAPRPNPECFFSLLLKKPVTASEEEVRVNPRARSAKLRAVERNAHSYSPMHLL